jgi:hypothetical protein|tara:strand:+ start:879 stop:1118 length:240 start_codon:yes stop_codon:yes gene_type:complete
MGKMKELDIELQDLRTEFFDSPASDQMSFDQFLIRKGKKNLSKLAASKRSKGGKIDKMGSGGGVCRGMGKARGGKYRIV